MPSPLLPDALTRALHDLPRGPLCVGYSGGLDSTVLLHALAGLPAARAHGLRAWHVHHGLQQQADEWAAHCQGVCDRLDVALTVSRVSVQPRGDGPEAAARRARREAFAAGLAEGEVLALAHHRDDQAETFLLRALRASGPDGLGAMQGWREFGRGHLWRPLLEVPRATLEAYAGAHGLAWIDDPSNADAGFDRNFLRLHVLPLLRERWPQADAALAGSAMLAAQAAELLDGEDAAALAAVAADDAHTVSRTGLRELPQARRARVLRRWIAGLGLPPLPANGIARIESELLDARADAEAKFAWHGAVVQAWRDGLHADVERTPLPAGWEAEWRGEEPLRLPGSDELVLRRRSNVSRDVARDELPAASRLTSLLRQGSCAETGPPWRVHARRGGERITLPGRQHSHTLKQALQDAAVPPWQRARLPLLSDADGELLAAGDKILSARFADWLQAHGMHLVWRDDSEPGDD